MIDPDMEEMRDHCKFVLFIPLIGYILNLLFAILIFNVFNVPEEEVHDYVMVINFIILCITIIVMAFINGAWEEAPFIIPGMIGTILGMRGGSGVLSKINFTLLGLGFVYSVILTILVDIILNIIHANDRRKKRLLHEKHRQQVEAVLDQIKEKQQFCLDINPFYSLINSDNYLDQRNIGSLLKEMDDKEKTECDILNIKAAKLNMKERIYFHGF